MIELQELQGNLNAGLNPQTLDSHIPSFVQYEHSIFSSNSRRMSFSRRNRRKAIKMPIPVVLKHYESMRPILLDEELVVPSVSIPSKKKNIERSHYDVTNCDSVAKKLIQLCNIEQEQDKRTSELLDSILSQLKEANRNQQVDHIRDITQNDCSLVHVCAQRNLVACLEVLLNHGASVDCMDSINATPLFYACAKNCKDSAAFLLSKSANVNARDIYGNFPLLITLKHSFLDLAELLLLFSADINQKGAKSFTCLHFMVRDGSITGLEFLMNHNASLLRLTEDGESILSLSLNRLNCLTYICTHTDNQTFLKLLSLRNYRGFSLLHECCYMGYIDALRIVLTEYGKRDSINQKLIQLLNEQDSEGRIPLTLAVINKRIDIVVMLCLMQEVNIDKADNNGNSPLHISIQYGDKMLIYLLVILGNANLDSKNQDRLSCWHLAKQMNIDLSFIMHSDTDVTQEKRTSFLTLSSLFSNKASNGFQVHTADDDSLSSQRSTDSECTSTSLRRCSSEYSVGSPRRSDQRSLQSQQMISNTNKRHAKRFSFKFSDMNFLGAEFLSEVDVVEVDTDTDCSILDNTDN
jgi:ankyrin repeat protein